MRFSHRINISRFRFVLSFMLSSVLAAIGTVAPFFFYLSLFYGALVALFYLRYMLSDPNSVTPYSLLAINFSAGYLIGPLIAVAYFLRPHAVSPILLSGPFAFNGDVETFAIATMFSSLIISELIFLGEFSSNRLLLYLGEYSQSPSKIRDRVFTVTITIVVIAALWLGDIGYMGVQTISNGTHITILGGLAGSILTAIPAIFVVRAFRTNESRLVRVIFLLVTLLVFVAISITGRRYLIYSLLSTIIIVFYFRPDIEKSIRIAKLKYIVNLRKILMFFMIGVVVLIGMSYFFALRIATDIGSAEQPLSTRIVRAWDILGGPIYKEHHFRSQSETRSGTLPGYLGSLMESNGENLNGVCMLYAVINSIPRLIFQNKFHLLDEYSCTDEHVNTLHGLPPFDSPTTILTQAYADFSYFGPILYVIFIGSLFAVVPWLMRMDGSRDFSVFAVALTLNTLLFTEQGLSFYFVSIRNLIIIFTFSYFIKIFLGRASTGLQRDAI